MLKENSNLIDNLLLYLRGQLSEEEKSEIEKELDNNKFSRMALEGLIVDQNLNEKIPFEEFCKKSQKDFLAQLDLVPTKRSVLIIPNTSKTKPYFLEKTMWLKVVAIGLLILFSISGIKYKSFMERESHDLTHQKKKSIPNLIENQIAFNESNQTTNLDENFEKNRSNKVKIKPNNLILKTEQIGQSNNSANKFFKEEEPSKKITNNKIEDKETKQKVRNPIFELIANDPNSHSLMGISSDSFFTVKKIVTSENKSFYSPTLRGGVYSLQLGVPFNIRKSELEKKETKDKTDNSKVNLHLIKEVGKDFTFEGSVILDNQLKELYKKHNTPKALALFKKSKKNQRLKNLSFGISITSFSVLVSRKTNLMRQNSATENPFNNFDKILLLSGITTLSSSVILNQRTKKLKLQSINEFNQQQNDNLIIGSNLSGSIHQELFSLKINF